MSSEVQIYNRALVKLGAQRVLSPDDDTPEGRVLKSMYDQVRDAELRRYRWKFAIKRAELLALVEKPLWGYAFQYPLPEDYLGLIQVGEYYVRALRQQNARWSVENNRIHTDMQAPLRIRYTARIEDSGIYDPLFVEVLACKLALEACETLTQSSGKKQDAANEYKFAVSEAIRMDSIENPPDELSEGTWLASRLDGYDVGGINSGDPWQAYPRGDV